MVISITPQVQFEAGFYFKNHNMNHSTVERSLVGKNDTIPEYPPVDDNACYDEVLQNI